MRNLFVCHTQAQLTLATGLVRGRFKNYENDLVLFVDFGVKPDLKKRLDKVFTRTLYLQSIYPAEFNTTKAKLMWYPKDWQQIKQFMDKPYDKVFAVCDWLLLVQKTLQRVYRMNHDADMCWLEDGITAYYQDSDIHRGMDSNPVTFALRRFLLRDLLGVGKFYDRDFVFCGGLKCLKSIYCCYPEIVREPYYSVKKKVGITDEEFNMGLETMYPKQELDIKPNSIILVVDKLDRYAFPDKVRASLGAFIEKCKSEGKTIICKFHPRETDVWDIFKECCQMNKSVGIESAYVSLADKKDSITIVGVKSAGLMTAKKLGYRSVSLFPSCGEKNDNLIIFYEKLGIELI